jgi:hypothetical protein
LELVAALCSTAGTRSNGTARARSDGVVAALAAALLLLQRRYDVTAREAATLQCCGAAVCNNGGRQCTKQGWRAALELATTAGSRAGRRRYAALQRWQAAAAEIFVFFFLLDNFKERTRAREREKRQGFETCFPALLVGKLLLVNSLFQRQLPLAATSTLAPFGSNSTLVSFGSNSTLAPSGSNSTSSTSNTKSSNDNLKKTQEFTSKRNLWLST